MARGYEFFQGLRTEIAVTNAHQQQVGNCQPMEQLQQTEKKSHHGPLAIANLQLGHYKPEEISIEVDNENVILHGQHVCEREDGFNKTEFMRVGKLPQGIDPTSVTSRITQDGSVLVIEGMKRVEENANDGKFEAKLDVRGLKAEDIKIQLRGNELTVIGNHASKRQGSSDYGRRILLPDDVILSSVTTRLSKEGVLTIEASRDPALLQSKRAAEVTVETEKEGSKPKTKTSPEAERKINRKQLLDSLCRDN